jgi:hypothetical protein
MNELMHITTATRERKMVRVLSQVCSNVILVAKNGYVEFLSVAVCSS